MPVGVERRLMRSHLFQDHPGHSNPVVPGLPQLPDDVGSGAAGRQKIYGIRIEDDQIQAFVSLERSGSLALSDYHQLIVAGLAQHRTANLNSEDGNRRFGSGSATCCAI